VKYVLYAFLAYLLFVFVFRLVVPVYLASRKIKKGFREMHSRMEEQMRQQQAYQEQQEQPRTTTKKEYKAGDYIDFEEMK
jgi:predicted Holliday junction resolvase-like endonuclease